MRCKTHIVAANALYLLTFNPSSSKELLIGISAATIGGIISDLDVRTSDAHKLIDFVSLFAFSGILITYILDLKYNYGIFSTIRDWNYFIPLLGLFLFLIVSFYGSHQPHRSFMHSFLGLFLFTGITYSCFGNIYLPFMLGMISHIFLDLLNKKNIRLFYPFKIGFCLNLCEFGGIVDSIIFVISLIFIILKLFVL